MQAHYVLQAMVDGIWERSRDKVRRRRSSSVPPVILEARRGRVAVLEGKVAPVVLVLGVHRNLLRDAGLTAAGDWHRRGGRREEQRGLGRRRIVFDRDLADARTGRGRRRRPLLEPELRELAGLEACVSRVLSATFDAARPVAWWLGRVHAIEL